MGTVDCKECNNIVLYIILKVLYQHRNSKNFGWEGD